MRRVAVICVLACIISGGLSYVAHAASLRVSPLRYDITLAPQEKKKGFVDITNTGSEAETVHFGVQAFRQSDDNGSLEFYDLPAVSDGILLDYDEVDIGARETIHLAFVADGTKLPSGDVLASIMAATVPRPGAAAQSVRVGALLVIDNGTPVPHKATIGNLSVPTIQYSDAITASFDVQNSTNTTKLAAFSPKISVSAWPYTDEAVDGPLVSSGRTRQVSYVKRGNFLGFVHVTVQTGDSKASGYSFVVTGYWRWVFPLLVAGVLSLVLWKTLRVRRSWAARAVAK